MDIAEKITQRRSLRPAPPRRPRRAMPPLTRSALHEHASSEPHSTLSHGLRELWDTGVEESRRAAAQMRRLAEFWADRDAPGAEASSGDEEDMQVALALRISEHTAHRRIRDAHVATAHLPQMFARLEEGQLPLPWMTRILRGVSDMSPQQRRAVDAELAGWDLSLTAEQFGRRLSLVLTRVRSREPRPPEQSPQALRRVEVMRADQEGMACLSVIGPVPAIRSLAVRLDATARAVQAAQRRALEAEPSGSSVLPDQRIAADESGEGSGTAVASGGPARIPFDDGTVRDRSRAMSLAALRFDILTRSILENDGAAVPAERFRINVTVPAMTLLGAADEPGMLEGITPIPAEMARSLAAGEGMWHRILTEPSTGAFLPLPSQRYAPTAAMLEHLRLRSATCAVPTCTRPSSWASECDHIEEYDHRSPAAGGQTEIENLHLLCWQHHQAKTAGRLDPVRIATAAGEPGATRWSYGSHGAITAQDDVDLVTPRIASALELHWNQHRSFERERARRDEQRRQEELAQQEQQRRREEHFRRGEQRRHGQSRRRYEGRSEEAHPPMDVRFDNRSPHQLTGSAVSAARSRSSAGFSRTDDAGPPPF